MKKIILFLFILLSFALQANEPVSIEEYQLQRSMDTEARENGWTFQYDVKNALKVGREWGLGYVKKPFTGKIVSLGDGEKLKN